MSSAAEPTATLYQNLQASGLLADAQLRELWDWLAHAKPDLQGMAREISRRGWLTPYQIKEVARGRGAALRVAGRYVLLDVLGEGGMGRVYKAHDSRMGRDVALKVIRKEKLAHPTTAGRFEQEIQALGTMRKHPNVVDVYAAERVEGHHFYVMELVDGSDLTRLVRDHGPMRIPEACEAIRQAAFGLQHAYESGLVHRDIKPSNIIVPRNGGAVKLVDLGLARLMDAPGGDDAHRVTQEGFVIGTPDFLAPEQARDPMKVDIRADVYALGGTLFYILTGRVPYDGGSATEKLLRHCTDPPPLLLPLRPDAPPQLEHLIHWAMAKRPEDRPQTPLQLAMALQPFCPNAVPGANAFGAPYGGAGSGGHAALPAAPAPTYRPPAPPLPLPLPEPAASDQAFRLPAQTTTDDPIRRRSEGGFPVGLVLVGFGTLLVLGIIGFAVYRAFNKTEAEEGTPDPFTNTVGMKLERLPGGTFRMGSPAEEVGRPADGREGPVREVTIGGSLFMSATEVTSAQYVQVMGSNPSRATKIAAKPQNLPVESVSWDDAVEFCRKLTEKEKGKPWMRKGWAYRLPTEAEWEYACRAGTDTPFAFGGQAVFGDQVVYQSDGIDRYELRGDPLKQLRLPQEAGKAAANKFGLHDMHGNVAEWCSDWYRPDAYKSGSSENPTGPTDGYLRVVRGGSFRDPASGTRAAVRDGRRPTQGFPTVGFRVVYAPVQK